MIMKPYIVVFVLFINVPSSDVVELDLVDCGVDHEPEVSIGEVPNEKYPWLGILFYTYYGDLGESRAVTTVALIQAEFVVAVSADIGPMPKIDFRTNARVLLGEGWQGRGRRVRNYVIHPHYPETHNAIALIQLRHPVKDSNIKPLCPPPERLRNPEFYVVKFDEDLKKLQKRVIPVEHVPASLCRDFYISASLYEAKMRPPHVTCAISFESLMPCVWDAGAVLVTRDVWGRWQLLGLGVRGPGCGAPARYLDMMSYYPWIESSLARFQRLTVSKLNDHKFVLRLGGVSEMYGSVTQRYGACDLWEKKNIIYRDSMVLRTSNVAYQFASYNMTLYAAVEYTCLTLELVNATATSEMRVKHMCPRHSYGPACHSYKSSVFEISVLIMFSEKCLFEMFAWGFYKNMSLLDIQEWKWEEGTYYEDFRAKHVEYRGPTYMTEFGYEPPVLSMWVPEFSVWRTTEFDNSTTTTGDPAADEQADKTLHLGYKYNPTTAVPTTTAPTRPTFKTRKTPRTTRRTEPPTRPPPAPPTQKSRKARTKYTDPTTTTPRSG